jgi:DNA helicase-2/ATP-dependent DNA helicase PcrA
VLCRTNAPLVEAAFGYASAGQKVAIAGGDIGDQLATLAKSFQAVDADDLRRKAEAFRAAELARLAEIDGSEDDASALADQCECIVTAAGWGGTIAEVIESIEDIFADPTKEDAKSYILLSSIHRAKGRESDRVAILAPESMPHKRAVTAEALTQEYNLAYVAATRSKDRLDFLGPIPDVYSPAYHAANAPEGGAA